MPIKKLTCCALLCASLSQISLGGQHVVRNGDNLFDIAKKYGVASKDILRANDLNPSAHLKIGQKLVIPRAGSATSPKKFSSKSSQPSGYIVRNGDHDWSIAAKFSIKPSELRSLNPGVNWRRLQIGQSINVGRTISAPVAAAKLTAKPTVVAKGSYKVHPGDNDWIIARKLGTTPKKLRLVNLGTKWTNLKPGQILRTPGATNLATSNLTKVASASQPKVPTIRSRYARVNGNSVTVRRGPTTSASRITLVAAGTRGTVLDREGAWVKLRFPHGTAGWVRADLLDPVSSPGKLPATSMTRVASAKSTSTKRSTSKTRVAEKSTPSKNPRIARTRSTRTAPSFSSTPAPNGLVASAVVNRAEDWKGVRYRYGAMSRSATDCSGFTSQVYKSVGVKLPRTSREQARVGAKVSPNGMKEGDLVFFRTSRGNRISHVGIYVGDGKFIHASSGKGQVRVDSLNSGYYRNRFVTARRVATKKAAPKPKAPAKVATKPAAPKPAPVESKPAEPVVAPTAPVTPPLTDSGEN